MSFSSGGGKTKYPKQKDVLETRYPEAVELENQLRDYFSALLSTPGMGYKARTTYDPLAMYGASIEDRGRMISGVTGRPWNPQGTPPSGGGGGQPWEQTGGGAGNAMSGPLLTGFAGLANNQEAAPRPAGGFWSGTAFERLTPGGPNILPDFSSRDQTNLTLDALKRKTRMEETKQQYQGGG